MDNLFLIIEWEDSYGALSGWVNVEDYSPDILTCISCGIKVYENKKVVALAPNFATATTYTPKQANGLMVIPKSCIKKITSFYRCDLDAVLKRKRQFQPQQK